MEAEVGENVGAARIVMARISVASWVRGGQSRDPTFSCLPELGRESGREEGLRALMGEGCQKSRETGGNEVNGRVRDGRG